MKKILKLAVLFSLLASPVMAKEIEGIRFDFNHKIGDKKVQLIGAGVRSKWFFKVYALGAYTTSRVCDRKKIIMSDEPKSLVLFMLRDVNAEQMASSINESLTKEIPDNSPLKEKRNAFTGLFKEKLLKGTKIVFDYLPGKGISVSQNGKNLGNIEGADFMQAFYKMYFEADGCCPELTKELLECEKEK